MKLFWRTVWDIYDNVKKLFNKNEDNDGFNLEDQQKVECIYDVLDRPCGRGSKRSVWLAGIVVKSVMFRSVVVVAIFLDSIVVALETNVTIEEQYGALLTGTSRFFLTLFVLEVLLKWHHDFLGYWRIGWNIFDFTVIYISFMAPSYLKGSSIMHSMKVLHATRCLRFVSVLPGLQPVIKTVIYSLPGMATVLFLLLIFMFSFAILGIAWFGNSCPVHFGSFEKAMFSLFVCITQDGWVDIKDELKSCASAVVGEIYLIIFITIGAFILINLVVAVVVTNLEWVIKTQTFDNKHSGCQPKQKQSGRVQACTVLLDIAQEPLNLDQENLEEYFRLVAELEKNFIQFKKLKGKLLKVQQEVGALENLEERYDTDEAEASFNNSLKQDEHLHHNMKKKLQTARRVNSNTFHKISEFISGSSLATRSNH